MATGKGQCTHRDPTENRSSPVRVSFVAGSHSDSKRGARGSGGREVQTGSAMRRHRIDSKIKFASYFNCQPCCHRRRRR